LRSSWHSLEDQHEQDDDEDDDQEPASDIHFASPLLHPIPGTGIAPLGGRFRRKLLDGNIYGSVVLVDEPLLRPSLVAELTLRSFSRFASCLVDVGVRIFVLPAIGLVTIGASLWSIGHDGSSCPCRGWDALADAVDDVHDQADEQHDEENPDDGGFIDVEVVIVYGFLKREVQIHFLPFFPRGFDP
jgi:hypothetical protein